MSLILFIFSLNAGAAPLPNFTPGNYELTEGTSETCGLGPMEYTEKNKYVVLSAFHILPADNRQEVTPADIPEEKGCKYKANNVRKVEKTTSTLKFQEVKTCGRIEHHTLSKKAEITAEQVILDVAQIGNAKVEGEPSYGFRCIWKLRGAANRGGASVEPKKAQKP